MLRRQGDLLADAAERAGLDATVPPCPPWQVKDLLRHTGYIHRWATRHVTECPDDVWTGRRKRKYAGGRRRPRIARLVPRRRRRPAETLSKRRSRPGSVPTFMAAPSPLAFWARRQAH